MPKQRVHSASEHFCASVDTVALYVFSNTFLLLNKNENLNGQNFLKCAAIIHFRALLYLHQVSNG